MVKAKRQAREVVAGVEEVASDFLELEAPRSEVNRRHPLVSVVTISVMAVLRATDEGKSDVSRPVFPIDGKSARRTHDRHWGLGALHSVSLWAADYGLSLGQVAFAEKSNEFTAIPELLKLVDTRGAIITIDAMGTQTAIAEQIIAGGADYVLALKGNQESLHDGVIKYLDQQIEADFSNHADRHRRDGGPVAGGGVAVVAKGSFRQLKVSGGRGAG